MTEEEKKNIEELKESTIQFIKEKGESGNYLWMEDNLILFLISIIEKQQTKITKLEEENEMLKGMFKKSMKE